MVRDLDLSNHIIFVLNTEDLTSRCGLRDFMLPLRSSSIPSAQLKTVVFYASRQVIETVWESVACFPRVFVYIVSFNLINSS